MADLMQFVPPGLRGPLRDVMGMGRVTAEGGAGLINAIRSNPMAVNKAIGESMIGAIADPVGTAKGVYQDVADTATGALTKTAADYLMDMYGIEPAEASPTQLRAANDARYADLAATAAAVLGQSKSQIRQTTTRPSLLASTHCNAAPVCLYLNFSLLLLSSLLALSNCGCV